MPHQRVLDFWFGRPGPTAEYLKERNKLWFGGAPETDQQITKFFSEDVHLAGQGAYQAWEGQPESCLALLLLLDQFSLNIHRDKAAGYLLSEKAIPVALGALSKGFDKGFSPPAKSFFYLPLEHAEDLSLQRDCVAYFTALEKECEGTFWAAFAKSSKDWAVRHLQVVENFGRFPHRNEALQRNSTQAEIEFLKKGAPF